MLNKDTLKQLQSLKTELRGTQKNTSSKPKKQRNAKRSSTKNTSKEASSKNTSGSNLRTATVRGTRYKYGFACFKDGPDVLIPADQMQRVYPDDVVEVEIITEAKKRPYARIARIINSKLTTVVGRIIVRKEHYFLDADVTGIHNNLFIPPPFRGDCKQGDYVVAKIIKHPFKEGKSQVKILEVIDDKEHPLPLAYVLKKYQFDTSNDFLTEKDAILARYTEATNNSNRQDLTQLDFISIDGDYTQDIDDALFVTPTDSGWKLYVAIADPCELIGHDDIIEKHARSLGSSVYLPKCKLPMLPHFVSSDLASLQYNEVRLCIICEMDVLTDASIEKTQLYEAKIRSRAKLTYNQVADVLDKTTQDDDSLEDSIIEQLKQLHAVSICLQQKHEARSINNRSTDINIIINDQYEIEHVEPFVNNAAHKLIEHIMISANEHVAQWLLNQEQHSVFNTHIGFKETQLTLIKQLLTSRAPEFADSDLSQLTNYQALMQHAQSTHKEVDDETSEASLLLILKGFLERSELKHTPSAHFGLGVKHYVYFTSPLRRYQDFLIHRTIKALLNKKKPSVITETQIAQLNDNVQRNRYAQRQLKDWLICNKLNTLKNTPFNAHITQMHGTHIVVTLDDYGISGNLDMRTFKEYKFNGSKKVYKNDTSALVLGERVQVTLMKIDWAHYAPVFSWVNPMTTDQTDSS